MDERDLEARINNLQEIGREINVRTSNLDAHLSWVRLLLIVLIVAVVIGYFF